VPGAIGRGWWSAAGIVEVILRKRRRGLMKALKALALAGVMLLTVTAPSQAKFGPRQYYTGWSTTSYGYSYRTYYYKPYTTYTSYSYHYVIYYPSQPYYYYYNPYTQAYWGRVPINNNGKEVYSLLAQEHRKGTLSEIKEEHFPKPGAMPKVPEATDDVKMEVPPNDLPTGETLPKKG
jgi:hypothetical protein